jgi:hypothetical protein
MADKNLITENELDGLLKDLYLDQNSSTANSKEANFILSQHYAVVMDAGKEKDLISRLQKGSAGNGNTWAFVSVLVVAMVTLLAVYFFNRKNESPSQNQSTSSYPATTSSANPQHIEVAGISEGNTSTQDHNPMLKPADTFDRPKRINTPIKTDSVIAKAKDVPVQNSLKQQEKKVPLLTEKDRLKYRNIKSQMILTLLKLNKGLYTKIPAYKTVYAGQPVILDGFAIRNVGITNLEYKTFLADLLAQNRDEDYLKCQVLNENWSKQGYPTLANTYFQDKTFNDFPVVNVSYEAAKLFCKWLEDETTTYIIQNNLKLKPLQIRLPYDEEWVFAAREGYAKIAFEKGYNTIYDEAVGLVNRSFTNRVELVKKYAERVDTLYSYFATNRYDWSEKEITDFFNTGLDYYKTTPTDTIYIDRMKVLGKFGHVSEMVPQKNTTKLWLTGLSWKSKEEYKKLESEFKANTCSPFVGFRIIVVNANDPEYKNPFW